MIVRVAGDNDVCARFEWPEVDVGGKQSLFGIGKLGLAHERKLLPGEHTLSLRNEDVRALGDDREDPAPLIVAPAHLLRGSRSGRGDHRPPPDASGSLPSAGHHGIWLEPPLDTFGLGLSPVLAGVSL